MVGVPSFRRPQRWKKLLYLSQPYPDNYTDVSFLDQLKTNSNISQYSYLKLVYDFSIISFYLLALVLNTLVFQLLYTHKLSPEHLSLASSFLTGIALIIYNSKHNHFLATNSKSFCIIVFVLLILSPVLRSLTKSTASDSIWALSFLLQLANALFYDYAFNSLNYRPIVSTNLLLANGVLLASRLLSTLEVFCFLLFTIQANILLPLFHFFTRTSMSYYFHFAMLFFVYVASSAIMASILDRKLLLFWWISQASIVFALPAYFLFLQKYKNELQGPWDPAKPILRPH